MFLGFREVFFMEPGLACVVRFIRIWHFHPCLPRFCPFPFLHGNPCIHITLSMGTATQPIAAKVYTVPWMWRSFSKAGFASSVPARAPIISPPAITTASMLQSAEIWFARSLFGLSPLSPCCSSKSAPPYDHFVSSSLLRSAGLQFTSLFIVRSFGPPGGPPRPEWRSAY